LESSRYNRTVTREVECIGLGWLDSGRVERVSDCSRVAVEVGLDHVKA
jgi:hypothetical protein